MFLLTFTLFTIYFFFIITCRQDLLDDSYYATSQGNVPSIQGGGSAQSSKDKQRYDVYARDSNNKNLKIRHVSGILIEFLIKFT